MITLNAKGAAPCKCVTGRIYFFCFEDGETKMIGGERLSGKYKYLSFQDREKIEAWYGAGDRPLEIAERLGVHTATIYHELQRGQTGRLDKNQRQEYNAVAAQRAVQENFKRRGRKRTPHAAPQS
jgi:hypothetical protein